MRKIVLISWVWFLSYFIIYSIFFQCVGFPENFCHSFLRFMQHLHIPYAVLAGITLFGLENELKVKKEFKNVIFVIILAFFIITTFIHMPINNNGIFRDARLDEQGIGEKVKLINETQEDSIIINSQASILNYDYFLGKGIKSVDINIYIANKNCSYTRKLIEENPDSHIYLLEDFPCEWVNFCDFIYENFDLNLLRNSSHARLYELISKRNFFTP